MRKNDGRPGFTVETSEGSLDARFVVAATGPFQRPVIPPIIPGDAGVEQIHSAAYRNPGQLPAGAVLVVGAGSSGVQIAAELQESGRRVYLSVGPHDRPPRRYRGRDNVWWLGVLGKWEMPTPPLGAEHVTIAVSGADGGHTVDFRDLAAQGITLVGQTAVVRRRHRALRGRTCATTSRPATRTTCRCSTRPTPTSRATGSTFPRSRTARVLGPDPDCVTSPVLELDLAGRGRHLGHLGDRLRHRLRLAARSTPSTRTAGRGTSAACRASPASTSSGCPGCRGAGRASSGACGTTPSTSPTRSPSSAATPHYPPATRQEGLTMKHTRIRPVQHQGHLPRAEPRQRPVPGRRRQRGRLHPRPDRPGPRHPGERRRRRPRGAGRQGDVQHQDCWSRRRAARWRTSSRSWCT